MLKHGCYIYTIISLLKILLFGNIQIRQLLDSKDVNAELEIEKIL